MECKFGHHFVDYVPHPFGPGNVPMPGFECNYTGEKEALEICPEDESCPAFRGVPGKYDEDERI